MHSYLFCSYAPAYWLEMSQLAESHPWMYEHVIESGSWTFQHPGGHSFAAIAADQAIEQTINRDTKKSGGLKGITLSSGMSCDC